MRVLLRPIALILASTLLGALAGRCLDRHMDILILSAGVGGVAIGCLVEPRRIAHRLAVLCVSSYAAGIVLDMLLNDVNCPVLPCVLAIAPLPFAAALGVGYWWVRPALRRRR